MAFWNKKPKKNSAMERLFKMPPSGIGISDADERKMQDMHPHPWTPAPVTDFIPEKWTKPSEPAYRSPFAPDWTAPADTQTKLDK